MNNDLLIDDILKEKANGEALRLPEDLNLKIKQTISDLPKRKKSRKIAKRSAVAAVLAIVVVTGLSAAFPVYARSMPVIGSVFQFLSEKNIIDREYVKYSSDLNLSKTSNDRTVTINSIAYDGIELSIAYTVESKEEMKVVPTITDKELKINGKITSFSSGGTGKYINKKTYAGVESFNVARDYLPKEIRKNILGGDVDIPDNFIMDFNIKEFLGGATGQWNFKFKVSLDKIKGEVKKAKIDVDLSKLAKDFSVNEVIFTPINTALRTIAKNDNSQEWVEFIALDDKGRGLLAKGSHGDGSRDTDKIYSEYTLENIYEDVKYITFIPTTFTKEVQDEMNNSNGDFKWEFKESKLNLDGTSILSEGRYGEYKIEKVETFDNKTLIYYQCTNLLPALQPYGLAIKDNNGKEYFLGKDNVKDMGDNKFVAEIEPLSKDKNYTISAADLEKMYDVREDLKFTVDVK